MRRQHPAASATGRTNTRGGPGLPGFATLVIKILHGRLTMAYDLVIRNGTIIDGSGGARYRADIGVNDGKITNIGRITESGRQDMDADGHVVSPGFVDGHTHMDAQVFWDPLGSCSCYHGVTSVVMGNCGFTLAPCKQEDADLVFRNLSLIHI